MTERIKTSRKTINKRLKKFPFTKLKQYDNI